MEAYSLFLIVVWLLPLWLLGWMVLPVSRFLLGDLADGGLAAGRVLAVAMIALVAFWGASLHFVPLQWSSLLWALPPTCGGAALLRCRLCRKCSGDFATFLLRKRRALILSDLCFIIAFLFFVGLRLCRPEINEFEKPMDSAIIGSLARSTFLPAENPWFAGTDFTNYYYFGHFMSAQLKRLFGTPLPYAYNLIQPTFCAFFLSTLWALCATLCSSCWRGALCTFMVGISGNFEPLRQWLSPAPSLNRSTSFPFLDWWSTSRVVPNTINEYPLFTLAIGDAHAHFFALTLTVLLFSSCYCLLSSSRIANAPYKTVLLPVIGLELGVILMTNAWDFPLYGLFVLVITVCYTAERLNSAQPHPNQWPTSTQRFSSSKLLFIVFCSLLPLFIALITALPFLKRFKPQSGGFIGELWLPDTPSFVLLWGGFLSLWLFYLLFAGRQTGQNRNAFDRSSDGAFLFSVLLFLLLVILCFFNVANFSNTNVAAGLLLFTGITFAARVLLPLLIPWVRATNVRLGATETRLFFFMLADVGLLALALPHFFYLQGYFAGDLRHQDTIFKFGQQAWLLLGIAASCGTVSLIQIRTSKSIALLMGIILAWTIPILCSLSVLLARISSTAQPKLLAHSAEFSLNGARFLPTADQKAITWLEMHAASDSYLFEAVGRDTNGNFIAAYSEFGRVSALTGIPAFIGWPQHAGFWGASQTEIHTRLLLTEAVFSYLHNLPDVLDQTGQIPLQRQTYIFYGDLERHTFPGEASTMRANVPGLKLLFHAGRTFIYRFERR